jgi:methylated-DNA-protein-cysteine methyltransferase related protein
VLVPSNPSQSTHVQTLAETVEAVLTSVRPGEVLTYGELARLAGHPGAARAVGRVMSRSSGLPWWRVVTSQGRLVPGHEGCQAEFLRSEGIEVVKGRCLLRSRQAPRPTPRV